MSNDIDPTDHHRPGILVSDVILAVALGLFVLILLAPITSTDSRPEQCHATFGYAVPCGWGLAIGLSLTIALVVGAALMVHLRHARRRVAPPAA